MNDFPANLTTRSSGSILPKVFGWMTLGLAISALTAYWAAATPAVLNFVLGNQTVFFGLLILEVVLVITLSWLVARISAGAATALFLLYSFINGLTLSAVILLFTDASLASTFLIAAVMFGAMALYGATTHRDLSRLGSVLLMALIGLIVASVVNLFINNNALEFIVSAVGVLIFAGLTAYDLQKIKNMEVFAADDAARGKYAVFGALMLYLDFINIFLSLLNFTGRRRK